MDKVDLDLRMFLHGIFLASSIIILVEGHFSATSVRHEYDANKCLVNSKQIYITSTLLSNILEILS